MIVSVSMSLLSANNNIFATKLPFKEGIVHYAITGSKRGTQTTYIRDFGKERVSYLHTQSKIMQSDAAEEMLILTTPKWTYHINLTTKEALKEPSLNALLIRNFNHLSKEEQKKITEKKCIPMLGFCARKESIAGVTSYYTKEGNLLLKSSTNILGYKVKKSAVNIEKVDVNNSLFTLPKDLKIIEKNADEKKVSHIINTLLQEKSCTLVKSHEDYSDIIQSGIKALDF